MRHGFVKVAAATPTIRVADCKFNAMKIMNLIDRASMEGVHVLVFPELTVTGYTCEDLFFQQALIESASEWTAKVAQHVPANMVVIFGAPLQLRGKLYNCAFVATDRHVIGIVPKSNIPNYQEFYEVRWFSPALPNMERIDFADRQVPMGSKILFCCNSLPCLKIGVEVCEDLWVPNPPSVNHAINGATIIANISASNEYAGKSGYRNILVQNQSARLKCTYIYANAGEGESSTDLVFTGTNIICENGDLLAYHSMKEDKLLVTETDLQSIENQRFLQNTFVSTNSTDYLHVGFDMEVGETALTKDVSMLPFLPSSLAKRESFCEEVLTLQCLGLKRHLVASRAKKAILHLSGGIDSTLALLVTCRTFRMLSMNFSDIICIPRYAEDSAPNFNTIQNLARLLGCTYMENSCFEHEKRAVVGSVDLTELAVGLSSFEPGTYAVNAGVPKTQVRYMLRYLADTMHNNELENLISDVLDSSSGSFALTDFFIFHIVKNGASPSKVLRLASYAFTDEYSKEEIKAKLIDFYNSFFEAQNRRTSIPGSPKVGPVTLSSRSDWRMPSDAHVDMWLKELEDEY